MRRTIAIVFATLTGCAAESTSHDVPAGGEGEGGGDHSSGGDDTTYQAVSSGYPDMATYCWDCGAHTGECVNETGDGYVCGSRPNLLCGPPCADTCVCPEALECVGSTCEPRACSTMEASPLPDCGRCMQTECCDELGTCFAEVGGCLDFSGDIRVDTPEGLALRDCQVVHCADACNAVCGRLELATDDEGLVACANEECCDELAACSGDGADWESCLWCIESGFGDLCDEVRSCLEACSN